MKADLLHVSNSFFLVNFVYEQVVEVFKSRIFSQNTQLSSSLEYKTGIIFMLKVSVNATDGGSLF